MSKATTALEQLRDMPDEELRQALDRTRDEAFRIQLGKYTNQVASPAQLRTKRREVATIMQILRGRELGLETQAQKTKKSAKKAK
jgi:ribosomal protein L29